MISLLKGTSTYLLFSIFSKAVPFFLLPVITFHLTPSEFGKWSIFLAILALTAPLINLNLRNQISRNFFKLKKIDLSLLFFNLIVINSFVFFFILFFVFLISFALKVNYFVNNYIFLIPIIIFFKTFVDYLLTILRLEFKPFPFGLIEIGNTLLHYLISTTLIIYFSFEWEGLLLGLLVSAILIGSLSLFLIIKKKYISFSFDSKIIKKSLKVCLPLTPYAITSTIVFLSDRLIIENLMGTSHAGIYSIGFTIGALVYFIVDAFKNIWSPWVYKKLSKVRMSVKIEFVHLTYLVFLFIPLVSISVCFFGFFYINYFINSSYKMALEVIYWTSFSFIFLGYYSTIYPLMVSKGKTFIFLVIGIVSSTINIILTIVLVTKNGIVGAAHATCITYIISFIILFVYTQKHYQLPWISYLIRLINGKSKLTKYLKTNHR